MGLKATEFDVIPRLAHSALLVEADEGYRATICACIRAAPCHVRSVATPGQALTVLVQDSVDVLVWGVADSDAPLRKEVIASLKDLTRAAIVVVDGSFGAGPLDLRAGADAWLPKPFVPNALISSIRTALQSQRGEPVGPRI